MAVSGAVTTLQVKPPLGLKIVAGLFIFFGASTIIEVVVALLRGHLNLNLGVLSLFVGLGLLRYSRGWRTCGLVFLWIAMISALFAGVLFFATDAPTHFAVFGQKVGDAPQALGVLFAAGVFGLAVWQYRVLTRPAIRALFVVPEHKQCVDQQPRPRSLPDAVQLLTKSALPDDFMRFLVAEGGGALSEHVFDVPHPSGDWIDTVDSFYVVEEVVERIETELMLREQGMRDIPDGMIPVAGNGMGDDILLSVRASGHGSVYFGFHEEMDVQSGSEAGLIKLSNSFSEWVETLRPSEGEE